MQLQNFINQLNSLTALSGRWLTEFHAQSLQQTAFGDSSSYLLLGEAKRIRPALALATAELLEVPVSQMRSTALALECLHAASLVHDDLPALDNAATRRGKASAHVKFGDGPALLLGDYLISRALEVVSGDDDLPLSSRTDVVKILSHAFSSLCEGQLLELNFQGRKPSVSELEECYLKKTGALFQAAMLAPLCFVDVHKREGVGENLSKYGLELGLVFQLTDDLLDHHSANGSDYLSLFGRAATKERIDVAVAHAREALGALGFENSFLSELLANISRRKI